MGGAGWNKLLEEWKARNGMLRDKLKFVIKALTDKDAAYILAAYNTMKQRCAMLNGVGMGDAGKMKAQLIKRLTNQGYNLQVMAINAIREYLTNARHREELERLEKERQQKEKDRILRRIMNGNLRMLGAAFRQALQWTVADREAEAKLMAKQRGIMRRIVDSNVRLMSAGWNKLLESWKARNSMLREKLKFVIKALTDKDANYKLMAYNAMKQRMHMFYGVGLGDSEMKKIQLASHGHQLYQGVLGIGKRQRRTRTGRVRKTTKRKGQNSEKDHERQSQNARCCFQASPAMDCCRQRGRSSFNEKTKRHYEQD